MRHRKLLVAAAVTAALSVLVAPVSSGASDESSPAGRPYGAPVIAPARELRGTARVELETSRDFRNIMAPQGLSVLYCAIEKVACAEWKSALRWVQGDVRWHEVPHSKRGFDFLDEWPVAEANEVLNSPDWVRFVVVRQPHERLLSAFGQKCRLHNWLTEYSNCPYLELFPSVFNGTVPDMRDVYTQRLITDAFASRGEVVMFHEYATSVSHRVMEAPCEQNLHYAPQYCHCSLDKTWPLFNFIRFGEGMAQEAADTFHATGAFAAKAEGHDRPGAAPMVVRSEEEVLKFLREDMGSNHDTDGKQTNSADLVARFYTPELKDLVRKAFHRDFELFSQYWPSEEEAQA